MIDFDSLINRWYILYQGRIVWFDCCDHAEDWIQLNHLEDYFNGLEKHHETRET